MAVLRLLLCAQFGESLADLREVEQRVVSEAILASRGFQNNAFGSAAEGLECPAVFSDGDYADKPSGTVFVRNIS